MSLQFRWDLATYELWLLWLVQSGQAEIAGLKAADPAPQEAK